MKNYDDKIGIIGLGKLGLPMLSAFVKRGFNPVGYDINKDLIQDLVSKKNPYEEPGISEIIKFDSFWSNRFYDDLETFLKSIDIAFLIVPTPTKEEIFDISYLENALDRVGEFLEKNDRKSLTIVITSTVNPGDCDAFESKYKNFDFDIVYSPEFIALGSVLEDMLHPDVVLLGGNSHKSVDKIFSVYSRLYQSHPEYHRLNFFEAETAKIGINTFVTTKISFANSIGMFIEKKLKSRQSAQRVLNAIGGDSRIGRKYFKYGMGYGGPCFPRDNRALSWHLDKDKISSLIPKATDEVNNSMIGYWNEKIESGGYDALLVIGVAYKKGTNLLEESFMIKLMQSVNMPTFYVDELVTDFKQATKLDFHNHYLSLKNYTKILVLANYGVFEFNESLNNLEIVNIWN